MIAKHTHIDQIVAAERTRSHGKDYALVPDDKGWTVYLVADKGDLRLVGVSVSREGTMRIVEDDASGVSSAHADKFHAWLDSRHDATPEEIKSAVEEAGYDMAHMGGGCLAWAKDVSDKERLLICTDGNDIDGDPRKREWLIGRHSYDGGMVELTEPFTLADAIAAIEKLPPSIDSNGAQLDIHAKTVEEAIAKHALIEGDIDNTRERMGYDKILKAKEIIVDGLRVEVALIGPGTHYGDQYALAIHTDCDPDHPDQGSSELNTFDDEQEAIKAWFEAVGEEYYAPESPTL